MEQGRKTEVPLAVDDMGEYIANPGILRLNPRSGISIAIHVPSLVIHREQSQWCQFTTKNQA